MHERGSIHLIKKGWITISSPFFMWVSFSVVKITDQSLDISIDMLRFNKTCQKGMFFSFVTNSFAADEVIKHKRRNYSYTGTSTENRLNRGRNSVYWLKIR